MKAISNVMKTGEKNINSKLEESNQPSAMTINERKPVSAGNEKCNGNEERNEENRRSNQQKKQWKKNESTKTTWQYNNERNEMKNVGIKEIYWKKSNNTISAENNERKYPKKKMKWKMKENVSNVAKYQSSQSACEMQRILRRRSLTKWRRSGKIRRKADETTMTENHHFLAVSWKWLIWLLASLAISVASQHQQ